MQNAESIPQGRERVKSISKKTIGALGLAVVMVGCGGGLLPVWAMTDASMIETTIVESELAGAPTVVTRLEREEQLGSYAGDIPASIILRVDAACNVVGEDGAVLGALTDIYADEIAGLMIPIVEIEDEGAAEALIGLWKSEWSISDMAVMSSDAQVLANVRSELTGIRGIYDVTGQTLSDEAALYEVVRTATLSMANVVLLSEAQSEPETVAYLQGRFKTVWTQLDEASEGDIFSVQNVVASGDVRDRLRGLSGRICGVSGISGARRLAHFSQHCAPRAADDDGGEFGCGRAGRSGCGRFAHRDRRPVQQGRRADHHA